MKNSNFTLIRRTSLTAVLAVSVFCAPAVPLVAAAATTKGQIDAKNFDVSEAGRAHAVRPGIVLDTNYVYATDAVAESKSTVGAGTGVGAVAGGAAGSAFKNNKTLAVGAGIVTGGLIGNLFDRAKKAKATAAATGVSLVVQMVDDNSICTIMQGVEPSIAKGSAVWVESGDNKLRVFPRDAGSTVQTAPVAAPVPISNVQGEDPEITAAKQRVATIRAQADSARKAAAAKAAKEKALADLAQQEADAQADLAATATSAR